jgi:crossover junction endodeoxyribonuclease RuvC
MGIDPGNVRAGYGIIQKEGGTLIHIASGILEIGGSSEIGAQLCALEKALRGVIGTYRPAAAGLERLFASNNAKTVMGVAEARGIIHKVIFESGIPLREFTPQTIKLSVTGNGRADKKAVAKMVGLILKMETKKLLDDTTDALAIAIAVAGG